MRTSLIKGILNAMTFLISESVVRTMPRNCPQGPHGIAYTRIVTTETSSPSKNDYTAASLMPELLPLY